MSLPFRIRMTGLPPSTCSATERIEAGLQHGQAIVQSLPPVGEALEFSGELRLKDTPLGEHAAPVFLGPYTHGPPAGRFIYVSWTGEEAGRRAMFRRMKIPLGGITWAQIEEVRRGPAAALVATVHGTDRRGGPACATVPLLGGGWQVESG